ncbi:MAG: branched-chain amino acid ABC transporter permease [Formosimonas sp.]
MDKFFQLLIGGVVVGSIYAMVALGYTMVYGILGIINFAHGEVMMVGAMVAMTVSGVLLSMHLPVLLVLLLAMVAAMVVCMVLSYSMEKVAYRPLRNAPKLAPLITAIGLSFLIQGVAQMIWGKSPQPFPDLLPADRIVLFSDVGITMREVVIVGLSLVMCMGLLTLVNKTKLGRAMRATSENVGVTGLMGVNPNRVISATFMIGAALAAVAGIMYAMNAGGKAHFYMGFMPGMKAFIAAVLGGIGNIPGAVVGGIVLGLAEAFGAGYISSEYQDVFAFIVLVGVLIFRPSGLLGQRTADRA